MVEANSSAAATNAGGWSSRKRRDSGSKNESVEHARTLRPSKRLKTLDISLPKPQTKKRRWNDRVETNREMGIAEEQDPETEEVVREHQESSRRRIHLRRGGDTAYGLIRNRVMTVSLQQRGESGLEDHLPGCKEEEDQTAEEKQKWKKAEEIWMQYSSPQIIDEDWKSQRLRYESSVTPHTKKRKAINSEELHQQQPQEKKTCIQADAQRGDQVLDSGDARMQKEAGGNRKWKRIPRSKSSDVNTSEDMGVMISEAWKRLREEEDNNDGENSVHTHSDIGSSLSTKTTEQETMTQGMSFKKVRLEKSSQGTKWRRLHPASAAAADKEGSVQQQHEGRDSDLLLGSSGGASYTYLHNRMWKRPRFENLISVQGKALRKQQQQQQQEMVQRSKKRSVSETPGVSRKKQRIQF
ncbi:unnamed protein product [Sphagnum jensenii]|uniref:Uncharacterized protein n=1 Tax=Sphagnum jensenii TaxID=128206 RepID=A0ABP1C0U6_9BRYO